MDLHSVWNKSGDYYHVTELENKNSILKNGLESDENGNIFIYDDPSITDLLIKNQLFFTKYVVFKIDSCGIDVDLQNDNVAESTANKQFVVAQNKIHSTYLSIYKTGEIDEFKTVLKENIRLFSIINPSFRSFSYLEKLNSIAESYKHNNKIFYNLIHKEIELQK